MKKIALSITALSTALLFSCGGNDNTPTSTDADTTENKEQTCFYQWDDNSSVVLAWTAFKTSDKIGVGGKFSQVLIKAGEKTTKLPELLRTVTFTIPTKSTNTENPDRDAKILNEFFLKMTNTDLILGQVTDVEGDNTSGKCNAIVTMNDVEQFVPLTYSVENDEIRFSGELDINSFKAEEALKSLNKACEDLHKGADGVSVTWPNVEINIKAKLSLDCH